MEGAGAGAAANFFNSSTLSMPNCCSACVKLTRAPLSVFTSANACPPERSCWLAASTL